MSGVAKQMSQLQRIVSTQWKPPYSASSSDVITLARQGNLVTAYGSYKTQQSGELGYTAQGANERLPYGYRPRDWAYIISGTGRWVIGYNPGNQTINVRGNTNGNQQTVTGTWFTDDPFPA